jgi:GT2 family glycosyltransferase
MTDQMPADEKQPRVCVIVLNYNGRRHLEYCLPSIRDTEYAPLTIIVVDNASTDGSPDYVRQEFPEVGLLISSQNLGWAGGNNLGISQARRLGAEYIVLANSDIRVDSRWIAGAVKAARSDPRIGIVGFRIFEPGEPGDTTAFRQAVAEWNALEYTDTLIVDGMAMFIRADALARLGPIDEGFFAYAEDNDLARRASKAGYRVVQTNVPVWHHTQGSFGARSLWAASLQIRNNLRLSLKHDSPAGVLYQWARHFAKGCLPFVKADLSNPIERRLRPSNILVNFGIWVYATAWNLWRLPATLRRRREDQQRIQATRHYLRTQ